MPSPEQLAEMCHNELLQRREEGCDVDALARRWAGLGLPHLEVHRRLPDPYRTTARTRVDEIEAIYRALEDLPGPRSTFPYHEPSSLEEIRRSRPVGRRADGHALSEPALHDRVLGAWLGRAAGCMLGKPFESWSRGAIRSLLDRGGDYPLRDYARRPASSDGDDERLTQLARRPANWFRGGIDRVVRDDDMDYPLIALHVLERYGPGFTTADVGRVWQEKLPYLLVYTAERAAYRNLVNGLEPPATANHRNPYREWIGAQIRADMWGWVSPGAPERAAEMAFRDASLSHVKNGLYGAMFFAAAIAAAFAVGSVSTA